jgi:acyl-CoA synthetase (AMP-forming)/AMP-acid ligase II
MKRSSIRSIAGRSKRFIDRYLHLVVLALVHVLLAPGRGKKSKSHVQALPIHGMTTNGKSRTSMKKYTTFLSTSSWWDKPAMLWDENDVVEDGGRVKQKVKSCYWDSDLLNQFSRAAVPRDGAHSYISYRYMFQIMFHLIQKLKFAIHTEMGDTATPPTTVPSVECNDNGDNNVLLPIAVAIPEGPLLPLAVLLVHVWNHPQPEYDPALPDQARQSTSDPFPYTLILVPLEPNEGRDRLVDMVQDVQPRIILACGEGDVIKLQDACQGDTNLEAARKAETSQVVDLRNWVQEAIDECYHSQVKQHMQKPLGPTLGQAENPAPTNSEKDWMSMEAGGIVEAPLPALILRYCIAMAKDEDAEYGPITTRKNPSDAPYIAGTQPVAPCISHIVFTSGTTGRPKGCVSSMAALTHYLHAKNKQHEISMDSVVFLASSLSFDPCLSDILATFYAKATLAMAPKRVILSGGGIGAGYGDSSHVLHRLAVSHVLCTPTIWSILTNTISPHHVPALRVVALGGEPIPLVIRQIWARPEPKSDTTSCDYDGDENSVSSLFSKVSASPGVCRLFATYGVTEACVYQTIGEIFRLDDKNDIHDDDEGKRTKDPSVGRPFDGLGVRICVETEQTRLIDVVSGNEKKNSTDNALDIGEVVLYGAQIDALASYWNRPTLTSQKYLRQEPEAWITSRKQPVASPSTPCPLLSTLSESRHFYRTGDLGYLHPDTLNLHILGRIQGEEGMVKIQGVRIELGEVEAALVDRYHHFSSGLSFPIVTQCLARAAHSAEETISINATSHVTTTAIHAFCVLSTPCLKELLGRSCFPFSDSDGSSSSSGSPPWGVLITGGAILTLLRARCLAKLKPAGIPSAFVAIPALPLSATGKIDKRKLPLLKNCLSLESVLYNLGHEIDGDNPRPRPQLLSAYGSAGALVSETIIDCLNLQSCQQEMVTTLATFSMLGGDSLAATRVIRALYAYHHSVDNTRFLGGSFGSDYGSFDVIHLIRARNLGDFVDLLDLKNLCQPKGYVVPSQGNESTVCHQSAKDSPHSLPTAFLSMEEFDDEKSQLESDLFEALMQALTSGQSSVAMALLDAGANPSFGDHGGRLGKVSGRREQKAIFRTTPLHLACLKGDHFLVEKLLEKKARYNIPDASGLFPINLAASGVDGEDSTPEEDRRRLACVKALLAAGAPIAMRDGNDQTVLHAAARAGHCFILESVMSLWNEQTGEQKGLKAAKHLFNCTDRWSRECTILHAP